MRTLAKMIFLSSKKVGRTSRFAWDRSRDSFSLRKFILVNLLILTVVFGTTGCTGKAKSARHLARADRYFAALDYPKAEVEYMNALQVNSTNAHAISRLGTIYYEQGRPGRAYAFLARASELNPNDAELHFKLGAIKLSAGLGKNAREEATLVLARMPAHPEAPMLLAESVALPKDISQVRQELEKLSAKSGETAPLQIALGILHFREKDLPSAERSFKRALALDPKSGSAHYALGNLYLARNDLKNAEPEFKSAAELSPARSSRRLSYADFKIKTGDLAEGKNLIAAIVKEAPDYLPAAVRQAEIALAEKKYADCDSLLKQTLARDPDNVEALLLRGRWLMATGEPVKAIADIERTSSKLQNKSPQAHYYLALAHLGNNDAPKASKSLAQAISLNPNFLEASLLLAELDIRRGDPTLAIPALTKIIQQQPQLPQAHLLLANAYLSQKKTGEAVAVFNQLMTLFPKNPQVPLLLGTVLMEQNKTIEARKAFEKSRALAPDYSLALERLVDLDLLDKQYPAAQERVKKQMQDYPAAPDPWLLLAKIHLAQKEMTEAETALLKVIELDVNQRNAYLLLAQIYSTSDRQQQALTKLNSLVAHKTNDIGAWMQIGMIHDGMKNYPAARDAYEKLLAINPRFSPALNNLAYICAERLVDLEKGLKIAEQARKLSANDLFTAASAADTLGWIYFKKGDYTRALALLQESSERLPKDPEIQFHLGMTHYMLGETASAQTALRKSMQDLKEFSGKDVGKKSLATLAMDPKNVDSATLKDLEKTLQNQPDDPIVLNLLTTVYERNGQTGKAVESCQAALARNPKNIPAMLGLIRFYSGSLKEPKKALVLAKDAHNIAPDNAHVSHLLGQLVYKSGDYPWSSSLFQEAARKLPNDPQLRYDLAWAEYNLGDVPEAVAHMENVAQSGKEFSRSADAQRFLALVRAAQNPDRLQSASTQASEILKTDSNYLPALMVSALLLEQQNKPAEAKRIFDQILSRNPAFLPAARNATLLAAQSSIEDPKAYELATRVRAAYPADPAVARALGILAYRKGDFVRSAQLLKESASKFQDDGESIYYLGMAHYRLKQPKESKAALQHALALNIPGKFADEANRILTELK